MFFGFIVEISKLLKTTEGPARAALSQSSGIARRMPLGRTESIQDRV
jgi:hypothetical protein